MTGEQEIDQELGPTLGHKLAPGEPKPRPMSQRAEKPQPLKPLAAFSTREAERQRIETLRRQNRLPLWCGPAHPTV